LYGYLIRELIIDVGTISTKNNLTGTTNIDPSSETLTNTINWSIGTEPLNTGNFFMLL
jgi:hypothetical protein